MVFILAASSLHHAVKTLPQALQDHYKKGIYAIQGLGFNPNEVKVRKAAEFQLNHFFRDKNRLVSLLSNSLSSHKPQKQWEHDSSQRTSERKLVGK